MRDLSRRQLLVGVSAATIAAALPTPNPAIRTVRFQAGTTFTPPRLIKVTITNVFHGANVWIPPERTTEDQDA